MVNISKKIVFTWLTRRYRVTVLTVSNREFLTFEARPLWQVESLFAYNSATSQNTLIAPFGLVSFANNS